MLADLHASNSTLLTIVLVVVIVAVVLYIIGRLPGPR